MNENNDIVKIEDITHAFLNSPEGGSLLMEDKKRVVRPRFKDEILSLFVLLNFPLFGMASGNMQLSLYGAVIEHGKTSLVELFFIDEKNEKYIGTYAIYKVEFPLGMYSSEYDEWLMDELASLAFGTKQEYKKLAKNIPFIESMF